MFIVIPDLHGRADLLEAAVDHYPSDTHFVVLGDAIDRGPNSKDAVKRLLGLSDAGRATLLRGNHEAMLNTVIECNRLWHLTGDNEFCDAAVRHFEHWTHNGGMVVVEEYGGFDPDSVPEDLVEYIHRTALTFEAHGVLASHAAPPVALPGYLSEDDVALWARPTKGPFPLPDHIKASIHGHTPLNAPTWVGPHLYIDLGALQSGLLCTVNMESLEAIVIQGARGARHETVWELVAKRDGVIRNHPVSMVEAQTRVLVAADS